MTKELSFSSCPPLPAENSAQFLEFAIGVPVLCLDPLAQLSAWLDRVYVLRYNVKIYV